MDATPPGDAGNPQPTGHSDAAPPPPPPSASSDLPAPPTTPHVAPGPGTPDATLSSDDKMWAMFAHLAGPIGSLLSSGGLGFVGPLIIWLVKKDTSDFVADQAKESLNFQLNMLVIGFVAAFVGIFLGVVTFGFGMCLVVPLLILLGLYVIIMPIIGGVKANEGVRFRYPAILRVVT